MQEKRIAALPEYFSTEHSGRVPVKMVIAQAICNIGNIKALP